MFIDKKNTNNGFVTSWHKKAIHSKAGKNGFLK